MTRPYKANEENADFRSNAVISGAVTQHPAACGLTGVLGVKGLEPVQLPDRFPVGDRNIVAVMKPGAGIQIFRRLT